MLSAQVTVASDALLPLPGVEADTAVTEIVRLKFDALDRPHALETHVILFSAAPTILRQKLEDLVILRPPAKSSEVDVAVLLAADLEPTLVSDRVYSQLLYVRVEEHLAREASP